MTELDPVLLYLESLPRQSEYLSPTSPGPSESRRMTVNEWAPSEADTQDRYGEVNGVNGNAREEEWDSDIQERMMSALGEPVQIHSTGLVRSCFLPNVSSI